MECYIPQLVQIAETTGSCSKETLPWAGVIIGDFLEEGSHGTDLGEEAEVTLQLTVQ